MSPDQTRDLVKQNAFSFIAIGLLALYVVLAFAVLELVPRCERSA